MCAGCEQGMSRACAGYEQGACALTGLQASSVLGAVTGVQPSDQLGCTNTNSKLWSRPSTAGPNKHNEIENG